MASIHCLRSAVDSANELKYPNRLSYVDKVRRHRLVDISIPTLVSTRPWRRCCPKSHPFMIVGTRRNANRDEHQLGREDKGID